MTCSSELADSPSGHSCVSKRDGNLIWHAKNPISSGLTRLSGVRPGSRLLLEPEHERFSHVVRISASSSERRPGPAAVS